MKIRALHLILLLQLVLASGIRAQSNSCDDRLDYIGEAQSAIAQADYAGALHAYDCASAADPYNAALQLDHLQAAVLSDDYLTAYSDALLLNNTSPQALLTALDELRTSAPQPSVRAFLALFAPVPDYDLALSAADQILTADPTSAFAYVIRAGAYEGLANTDAAAAAFGQAVELSPDDAQIYGLMAAAQFSVFNIPGMRENSTRALELDPTSPPLYRLRGFTSMVMGDPQATIEDANRAIELDPNYFAYYVLRGNAYRALGELEAALGQFDRVIALVPQSGFGYALRAQTYMQLGQVSPAAADFSSAIELSTLERVSGAPLESGQAVTLPMTYGRTYYLPFTGAAGAELTLSVTSKQLGAVDPIMLIVAPDGTPLMFNDDADPDNNVLDALIADYPISTDGSYTLVVSHARGGSEGEISVLVQAK